MSGCPNVCERNRREASGHRGRFDHSRQMEFRLVYRRPLHATGGLAEKQAIRRTFLAQLAELWSQRPLAEVADVLVPFRFVPLAGPGQAL